MSHNGYERNRVKEIPVTYYNIKELANIYEVSRYKMRHRIDRVKEQIGEPEDGYDYSPRQVKRLFELLPLPDNVTIKTKGSA
jgi:hypothetical protein